MNRWQGLSRHAVQRGRHLWLFPTRATQLTLRSISGLINDRHRHPAALLVFSALARHKALISSKVKVTAMEGGGLPAPATGTCHLLAFPAGLLYTSLPLPKLGQAAVHAVADDARALPSLDRAVRMCQVGESAVEGEARGVIASVAG